LLALSAARPHHDRHHHKNNEKRHAMIKEVNSMNAGWKAGINSRFDGKPTEYVKKLLGFKPIPGMRPAIQVHTGFDMAALPQNFDSRTNWPNCPSIQEVRDQSDCGSCWAFGAVEAATDRICIESNGASQPHLSAEDLLSCCIFCGAGCDGGDPAAAWSYFTSTGVVTGGNYGDYSWCSSYSLPNCDHHTTGHYAPCSAGSEYPTPSCPTACDSNSTYSVPFTTDKHIFATSYSVGQDPAQIQQEIMTNGPVEAAFTVYADFESYKSGIYRHVSGEELGGHAVKIIGWGYDAPSSTNYWIVANSWNNDWGENGFFRIAFGECGIESYIVGGLFKSSK